MNKIEENKFSKLFGIKYQEVGDFVVISPFFNAKLFAVQLKDVKFFKGMIFHGLNGTYKDKKITFIHTGMGQSLVADCVMAQDNQKVKTIVFLGAVGAVRDLDIADNLVIEKAFFDTEYYNKFGIKLGESTTKEFFPDNELVERCLIMAKAQYFVLKKANAISIHTFLDQGPEIAKKLSLLGIQSVDLECALFYAAASRMKIKAIAFCFVSDNLLSKPFWGDFSLLDQVNIKNQMPKLVKFSLEFAKDVLP
ncbi:MAG: hypothetical protein V1747_10510 [Candidatus Omnitrophota bacterium]